MPSAVLSAKEMDRRWRTVNDIDLKGLIVKAASWTDSELRLQLTDGHELVFSSNNSNVAVLLNESASGFLTRDDVEIMLVTGGSERVWNRVAELSGIEGVVLVGVWFAESYVVLYTSAFSIWVSTYQHGTLDMLYWCKTDW